MVKGKKRIITPKRIGLFIVKLILWLTPILIISCLLQVIITGGQTYGFRFWGDWAAITLVILIPVAPFMMGSLTETFYAPEKPKKPKTKQISQAKITPQPQIVSNSSSTSIWQIIFGIIAIIIAFAVIKGFLDWWFGLFGLGIGLILLILIFG